VDKSGGGSMNHWGVVNHWSMNDWGCGVGVGVGWGVVDDGSRISSSYCWSSNKDVSLSAGPGLSVGSKVGSLGSSNLGGVLWDPWPSNVPMDSRVPEGIVMDGSGVPEGIVVHGVLVPQGISNPLGAGCGNQGEEDEGVHISAGELERERSE